MVCQRCFAYPAVTWINWGGQRIQNVCDPCFTEVQKHRLTERKNVRAMRPTPIQENVYAR